MIPRRSEKHIEKIAKQFPIIGILGPRQSGKTTLARKLFSQYTYFSLEDPDTLAFIVADPRGFFENNPRDIILDEAQNYPEIFSYLQSHVDELNVNGAIVITGSNNYLLMERITQSLAGRIGLTTLLPFSIAEISQYGKIMSTDELLYAGSYPRLYEQKIDPEEYYSNYVKTYIERDVRQLRSITDYNTFYKFMRILAGRSGQVLNTQAIADEADVSHETVNDWLSILITGHIIYFLPPFYKNYRKRITKKQKIYFYDTGLVCYLLGLTDAAQIANHYLRGSIFETLIISNYHKAVANKDLQGTLYFWEENKRKEIDLIVEHANDLDTIEIKVSKTFRTEFMKHINYFATLEKRKVINKKVVLDSKELSVLEGVELIPWRTLD